MGKPRHSSFNRRRCRKQRKERQYNWETPRQKKERLKLIELCFVFVTRFCGRAVDNFLYFHHLSPWQCLATVTRNYMSMPENRSSRLLPVIWHLVKSLLIQQSVRFLRAVYGACNGRRNTEYPIKRNKGEKIQQKLQIPGTSTGSTITIQLWFLIVRWCLQIKSGLVRCTWQAHVWRPGGIGYDASVKVKDFCFTSWLDFQSLWESGYL